MLSRFPVFRHTLEVFHCLLEENDNLFKDCLVRLLQSILPPEIILKSLQLVLKGWDVDKHIKTWQLLAL